jgi:hypothetical protein
MRDDDFKPTMMGLLMHVLISILLVLGFVFVLLFGFMSVLQDLVSMSIYQPPSEFDAHGEQRREPTDVSRSAASMPISQLRES